MATYLKTEILRVLRNRRYVLFALAVPVGAYLLFGKALDHGGAVRGTSGTTFFMVSMAAYSAMLAVVFRSSRPPRSTGRTWPCWTSRCRAWTAWSRRPRSARPCPAARR